MDDRRRGAERTGGAPSNVGAGERAASAVGGGALVVYGLTRRSLGGALLAGLGGVLAYRGITGHCPAYGALGISTADDRRTVEERLAERGETVERVITVNRSPAELYAFWRNLANLPKFMSHLAAVEVLDAGRSRWAANGPAGSTVEWEAMITEDLPNRAIAWRSLAEADVDNAGRVEFISAPDGAGTEVRVSLRYAPPAGKAGTMVAKLLGADPATQIGADLHRLQQIMETGEIASSDPGRSAGEATERRFGWGTRDSVEEASWESFPASDPPAW